MAKRDKAVSAAKRDPNVLRVDAVIGEDPDTALARAITRPSVQAALTLRAYPLTVAGIKPPLNALVDELGAQCKAVNDGTLQRGEAMLTAQAHTLDAIFGDLARRAKASDMLNQFEVFMRLAFKAQAQCRATWEALAAMKNPAPVAFVRQANIAHGPQQVNNGPTDVTPASEARARESESKPNRLTGVDHGLRPNIGASPLAGRADPQAAAVGQVDGAKDSGG